MLCLSSIYHPSFLLSYIIYALLHVLFPMKKWSIAVEKHINYRRCTWRICREKTNALSMAVFRDKLIPDSWFSETRKTIRDVQTWATISSGFGQQSVCGSFVRNLSFPYQQPPKLGSRIKNYEFHLNKNYVFQERGNFIFINFIHCHFYTCDETDNQSQKINKNIGTVSFCTHYVYL